MDPTELGALMQAIFGGGAATAAPMIPPVPPVAPVPASPEMLAASPPMLPRPTEPYMTQPMPLMPGAATLGAALDPLAPGVPMPRPRPIEAPGGTYAAQAGGSPNATGMLDALKGVVAPPPPQAQKVSTPHAPPMAKIVGGGVAELLASLGIGPQQAFPGLKLPSTLGQALGGR